MGWDTLPQCRRLLTRLWTAPVVPDRSGLADTVRTGPDPQTQSRPTGTVHFHWHSLDQSRPASTVQSCSDPLAQSRPVRTLDRFGPAFKGLLCNVGRSLTSRIPDGLINTGIKANYSQLLLSQRLGTMTADTPDPTIHLSAAHQWPQRRVGLRQYCSSVNTSLNNTSTLSSFSHFSIMIQ